MSKMKRIVPFSNGTEAMDWMDHNCDVCKTRYGCAVRRAMELGFVLGDISMRSAVLIGITDEGLNAICQMKDKRKTAEKHKRVMIDDYSSLF